MSEYDETVWRTSPGRVGKLMAILGGTVIVGTIIFFGYCWHNNILCPWRFLDF